MITPEPRASFVGLLLLGVAVSLGVGCSSGGHGTQGYQDAVASGTGGNVDGGGASNGGSGGTVGTTDGSVGNTDAPLVPGALQLLAGPALLVGPGGTGCSLAAAPAGGVKPDQWCGVITRGATAGTFALLVFNLTKALAGTALTCTAGDPNCLTVSTNLGIDFAMGTGDAAHGFFGDTLIYYEAQSVLAWRPGWSAGRVLGTRDQIVQCFGGRRAPTAICFKATADPTILNLYAGRLDTPTGPALPLIEAVSADVGSIRFSPDSQSVLWSTATGTGSETLKIQTIGDATTKATVAVNVTGWSLTADGLRWLWLSQPVLGPAGATTGTLQSAPFPGGTPASNIQALTVDYVSWNATSLVALANPTMGGADLRVIPDINNPATNVKVLATQTAFGLQAVTTAGNILYFDDFDATNNLSNLRTAKADGTGACAVTTLPNADPSASFTSSSLGVDWFRVTVTASGTASAQGVLTTLSDCLPHAFSTSPAAFLDVPAGLILQDKYNSTAGTATLSFLPYVPNGTLGSALVIHAVANPTIMALFPDVPRVVYTVNAPPLASGVYVSGLLGETTQAFMPDTQQAAARSASAAVPAARAVLRKDGQSFRSPLDHSFVAKGRALQPISPSFLGNRVVRLPGL